MSSYWWDSVFNTHFIRFIEHWKKGNTFGLSQRCITVMHFTVIVVNFSWVKFEIVGICIDAMFTESALQMLGTLQDWPEAANNIKNKKTSISMT